MGFNPSQALYYTHKTDSKKVWAARNDAFIPRPVFNHTIKPIHRLLKNHSPLLTAHQKTIPSGTEDELTA